MNVIKVPLVIYFFFSYAFTIIYVKIYFIILAILLILIGCSLLNSKYLTQVQVDSNGEQNSQNPTALLILIAGGAILFSTVIYGTSNRDIITKEWQATRLYHFLHS